MLKLRIVTGVIMVAVFLVALLWFDPVSFSVFLSLLASVAAWEWARIAGYNLQYQRITYTAMVLLLLCLLFLLPLSVDSTGLRYVLLLGVLVWISICVLLYLQPVKTALQKNLSPEYILTGPLVIVPAVLSAQHLRSVSPGLLLLALALVWAMDIGAYFTGKRFGKRKLAPLISPGKTIEGVLGGVVVTLSLWLAVEVFSDGFDYPAHSLFLAIVLAGAISVVGDLYESRGKRMRGIKDSSQILPGHGGILDRLDSAFAALPVFTFILIWTH